tara:strand:- start:295 stop:465 length:171 start_codon:yes stop_codon:yes gene_type:complete
MFWNRKYKPHLSNSRNKAKLMQLDKKKLEAIGREHGVELDRRRSVENLVDSLYPYL